MDPRIASVTVLAATVALIAIRAPHGQRSRSVKVERTAKGRQETVLLTLAWISFFLPLTWAISRFWAGAGLLAFADHPLHPVPYAAGIACLVVGLWLFHRSHADLGTNWSITLEIREGHRLVTEGVYRRVRHPMYSALLLYALGMGLVLPNAVAGPSYLVAMSLLVALRLGPEERMMRERFGAAYDEYVARTSRLVPGVW